MYYLSSGEHARRSDLKEDENSSESGALTVINEALLNEDSDGEYASIESRDEDSSSLSPVLYA